MSFLGAYGQDYKIYNTKQGLPSNYVYHSIQDSKGYMWFATNRGIAKFDGENFKIFTTKDGLPNNDIWKLIADDQGRVWFNTKSKYTGFIQNDSVYKFKTDDETIFTKSLWKIEHDKVVSKYLGSLFVLNEDSLIIEKENHFTKNSILKQKQVIQSFDSSANGDFFLLDFETKEMVIVYEDRVYIYDSNLFKTSTINLGKSFLYKIKDSYLKGILPNKSLFLANKLGIFFINLRSRNIQYYSSKDLTGKKIWNNVPVITEFNNQIQLSVAGHLIILNNRFEILEKFSFEEFPNNFNSFKDINGNIWLNDKNKGIILLPNIKYSTDKFLSQKRIQKLGKINDTIVAGEYAKGLHFFENSTNQFKRAGGINYKNNIYQIKSGYERGKTSLVSNPSFIIDAHANLLTTNSLLSDEYETLNKVTKRLKDVEFKNDTMFVSHHAGLSVINLTKKEIYRVLKNGISSISNFKNQIYAGSSDGLFVLVKDSFEPVSRDSIIFETPIISLQKDKNYLYVGTDGRGLYLYDGKTISHLRSTDGLIIQKTIRQGNKLWLATQKGVQVVTLNLDELEKSEITNSFYDVDGLFQNNTNDIFLEDSLLWVATDIGVSRLNLTSSLYKQKSAVIFDIEADTISYNYGGQNQISVSFHVLNFNNQDYLEYEYRLLPSLKEWVKTTTLAQNFTGLAPDLYTFEVRVTDQHNNQTISKQYIHILPGWWQTNWAKALFIILSIFFFILIFKLLQRRIKESESKKTKLAGLELQALRSQMNPHFVHNSLNAIKYYVQRNEVEMSEKYLTKFSKLIRLFFDFSRRENVTIREEVHLLTLYLEIEQLRFEEKLSYGIEIDKNIEDLLIPSMMLQPLLENAVNHGVFHKKGRGVVRLLFSSVDTDTYKVVIEDDGIGVNNAKNINKISSENYKSKSSEVLKDRLDLLNKSKFWDITYSLEDLLEKENGKGTRVSLLFKQIK